MSQAMVVAAPSSSTQPTPRRQRDDLIARETMQPQLQPTASTSNVEAGTGPVDTTSDLIAGWLGGAAGILVSNPLEVLKVRLQTARVPSNRVGRSSPPPTASASSAMPSATATFTPAASTTAASSLSSSSSTTRPGLTSLWKSEGARFLFAGAAGPILGLAFIDSAFFGLYGQFMSRFDQDRQDPTSLTKVFVAGATAGGLCALLETPIEVVKCRAQVESGAGAKLGSFKIASMIARHEGLRGFYIGGLMTAIHDGISSGIFFCGSRTTRIADFMFRRMLRGESPYFTPPIPPRIPASTAIPDSPFSSASAPSSAAAAPTTTADGHLSCPEIGRILLAGGFAGALSAVVPYPFDIIKTRLQTSNFEALSGSPTITAPLAPSSRPMPTPAAPPQSLSIRSVARGIHADGVASYRYRYTTTVLHSLITHYLYPNPKHAPSTSFSSTSSFISNQTSSSKTNMIDGRPGPDPRAAKLTLRLLGFKGFLTGIKPTLVSSFVGSAVTITGFEVALHWLTGGQGGGGGGIG
ncbi:BQ2448_5763 [Microbotryum intermedium]|uniref:BQ2448_5763 protein n=1 Tax=Microbotryum intermedium TaxID=269621 RepID=A0A238F255_9BASI|nr:BQ2448_5763 [Microbotryum intermedium]